MTIVFFIIYIVIGLLDQTANSDLTAYGNGGDNMMFATLLQPWNFGSTNVNIGGIQVPTLLGILGSAITIAVGIALISSVIGRSDIVTLYALFGAFLALGAPTIIVLYSFLTRNVGMMACAAGTNCYAANLVGALLAGSMGIMWLFTCGEWWAWRSMTQ